MTAATVESAEFNLMRQREAFEAIEETRKALGISLSRAWKHHGICINSLYAWRSGHRTPSLQKVIKVAETFGFEVVMTRGAEVYNMNDTPTAMLALDSKRQAAGISLAEMEEKSGVSINSFYAWRSNARSPSLCNIVAFSQTFGFEVIMRRKADA